MKELYRFRQYLAEGEIKENALAQKLKDEAKHPDSKVGAAIFNKYAKKIENADKADYKKIIKAMESELISKHPDTFSGEDDIPGSFLAEGKLLKEVMDEEMVDYVSAMYDSDVDQEAEEGFQSDVWSKAEYASNAYDESSIFLELIDHLKSVGGKDVVEGNPDIELELLPNGDIRWGANVTHY